MLEPEIKQLYNSWLTTDCGCVKKIEVQPFGVSEVPCTVFALHYQVLRNLHNYLKEVEAKLKTAESSSE